MGYVFDDYDSSEYKFKTTTGLHIFTGCAVAGSAAVFALGGFTLVAAATAIWAGFPIGACLGYLLSEAGWAVKKRAIAQSVREREAQKPIDIEMHSSLSSHPLSTKFSAKGVKKTDKPIQIGKQNSQFKL